MNFQVNDFDVVLNTYISEINAAAEKFLPDRGNIFNAMRYSFFAGGKRIRPVITLAWCNMLEADYKKAIPFACALEMIHTYSLIHDDLPCMDNDVLRRGKPTCHVVFGEATALLAGNALLTTAIETILNYGNEYGLCQEQILKGISVLLNAAGTNGILQGQLFDMENTGNSKVDLAFLETTNSMKTGAMLEASSLLGCIAAQAGETQQRYAVLYAKALGQAFQIKDDILDITGNPVDLGKTNGKDGQSKKITYANLLGIQEAQKEVLRLTKSAEDILLNFNNNKFLLILTNKLCNRNK